MRVTVENITPLAEHFAQAARRSHRSQLQ